MTTSFKLAILGTGATARERIVAARKLSRVGVEVVAIAAMRDRDSLAERLAATFSIPMVHGSLDRMLDGSMPDAVVIAVPAEYQEEATIKVLKYGCHAFCEAPFGDSMEAALGISRAWEESTDLVLEGGYPDGLQVDWVRQANEARELGELQFVEGTWLRPVGASERGRSDFHRFRSEGGRQRFVEEMVGPLVSVGMSLLGSPGALVVDSPEFDFDLAQAGSGFGDTTRLSLSYANRTGGRFTAGWDAPTEAAEHSIRFKGDGGAIELSLGDIDVAQSMRTKQLRQWVRKCRDVSLRRGPSFVTAMEVRRVLDFTAELMRPRG